MDYALLQKIYNIKSFVGYTDEEIKELRAGFESIPHTLYEIWVCVVLWFYKRAVQS